jgi:hypothetical protein
MQNFDHNIGFCEKRKFLCRKLGKIAENWEKSQKIVIITSAPGHKHGSASSAVFACFQLKF